MPNNEEKVAAYFSAASSLHLLLFLLSNGHCSIFSRYQIVSCYSGKLNSSFAFACAIVA